MSFSEKPDDDFSQKDQEGGEENNDDITNIEENQRNSLEYQNNINNKTPYKKKNRTLQFYKFLFYTMKTEIKINDFLKLLRNSNTAELTLWTISVLLFANIPKNFPILKEGEKSTAKYSGVFLWLHLLHIGRACLGMYIGYKLPRSYRVMDELQSLPDEKLAKTLFNDIIRETLLSQAVYVIKERRFLILIYFIISVLNVLIDLIDFLVVLARLSNCASSAKVMFISYFIIANFYLVIDFAYFFWAGQLKYIFPPDYIRPIADLLKGIIDRIVMTFKLGKDKTNVISEAKAQKSKGPYVKETGDMNNGGINLLEYIMHDSLGVYNVEERDKYLPNVNNQNINMDNNIRNNLEKSTPSSNDMLN